MKTKINYFALLVILWITTVSASAQTKQSHEKRTRFSLEIDPATFVFKGYSAHLRVQPKSSNHMLYGLGIYAMDMPSFFVDINSNNANEGWNVRIDRGVGLFGEYHFTEVNKKFFVGAQVSAQQFQIKNDDLPGQEHFTNGLLMGYGGYTLQPFSVPLYFKLWGGVGYAAKMSGENVLEGKEYDISPISMFATFHIGYTL